MRGERSESGDVCTTGSRRNDGNVITAAGARARTGCATEPVYVCAGLAVVVAGGFVCGWRYIPIWILLVFHCYTDIRVRQVYCLPTRICIAADVTVCIAGGMAGKEYISAVLCVAAVVLLSVVFHMYAQGDAEVFVMLIAAAVVRGQAVVGYTVNIVWMSGILFCLMLLVKNIIVAVRCAACGNRFKFIRTGPMVPAIAAAFLVTCVQWRISFTAMS